MKRIALAVLVLVAVAATTLFAFNRPGAKAGPDVTITVNSTADTDDRNDVLTLREAMMLATGARPLGDLHEGECNQVSGAIWQNGVFFECESTDPPGAASADTITFDPTVFPLGSPTAIALTSALPSLATGNVTVDGSPAGVILNGGGLVTDCLVISSNNNTIKGLEIRNCTVGVWILTGSQNNTLGGSSPSERNVISGHSANGVTISGIGTTGNVVRANYIGTDASGTAANANGGVGVFIGEGAQSNTIQDSVISGNTGSGVHITDSGTDGNIVKGNYLGIDPFGAALPNGQDGVHIANGAKNNTVENNVISGNGEDGVHLRSAATDTNFLKGNKIGTNAAGDAALPNGSYGVYISEGAQSNTLESNVISGNSTGVEIRGSGTDGNVLIGNYLGVDAAGAAAIPNTFAGVQIWEDAQNNTVGGSNPGEGNVISGNGFEGVQIRENANGNFVIGNYIGTDASGAVPIPNGFQGVQIRAGAQNNRVEGNVISGNGFEGVEVRGGATGNVVIGNRIGVDSTGTAAVPNADNGVEIRGGAQNNTVGGTGPGEGNVISGNAADGVEIRGGATGNVVIGNQIGTDSSGTAPIPNGIEGLEISDGAQDNTVGGAVAGQGNVIAFNTGNGVTVSSADTTGNTIRGNSIHSNGGKGIELVDGGNTELAPPTITGFGSVSGTACSNCAIDIYSDQDDEGELYEGSTTADPAGDWTFPGSPQGPNVTATATDPDGNTSEFSAAVPVPIATATPTPTATPPPGPTRTLVWGPGWHNATWTGTSTPEQAFACADGSYAAAYRHVDSTLERYFPNRPDISNMNPLQQYAAFLILITEEVTCEMPVAEPPADERTLDWSAGWHNDGWTGPDGTPPQDAFACADGSYAAAYRLVSGGWERYFPDRPDLSNMAPLNKYDTFLILVTAPVSCTMPIAP